MSQLGGSLSVVLAIILWSSTAFAFGKKDYQYPERFNDPQIPLIAPGFYQVQPNVFADHPYGEWVYLRNKDFFDKKSNQIFTGIQGIFSKKGKFTSRFIMDDRGYRVEIRAGKEIIQFQSLGLDRLRAGEVEFVYLSRKLPTVQTRLLSHRGVARFPLANREAIYPDNSLEAMEEALVAGFEGFEIDVRVSKDLKFVVTHDQNLKFATDCKGITFEKTFEELLQCRVDASTFIPNVAGSKTKVRPMMAGLNTVLERYLDDPRVSEIYLDVKDWDESMVDPVVTAFDQAFSGVQDRELLAKVSVIHSRQDVLGRLKARFPMMEFALEGSTGLEPVFKQKDYVPEAYDLPRQNHTAISLNLGMLLILPGNPIGQLLVRAHLNQYEVLAWTINSQGSLERLFRNYPLMDSMLTDVPMDRLARAQLQAFSLDFEFAPLSVIADIRQ